jgi:pimeloyl-ACP methyl ester carboxylesterase
VAPLLVPLDAPFELMMEAVTEGKDAAYLADLASLDGLHEQLALAALAAVERGLAGAERDMRAMVSPWPFELAHVQVPVMLWYGTEDHRFKPPAGQWLADRLADARLEVLEGTSHLLPLVYWAQLMNELVVRTRARAAQAPQAL